MIQKNKRYIATVAQIKGSDLFLNSTLPLPLELGKQIGPSPFGLKVLTGIRC